jgi:hypothetical protein
MKMNNIITMNGVVIETKQGINQNDEKFGYIHCGDGGYFFDWKPTLEETLESITQDNDTTAEEPTIGYTDAKEALRGAIADEFVSTKFQK